MTSTTQSGRPKWEEDQIKSFVTWANFTWNNSQKSRGRPVSPLIQDINTDFKDGTRAAMLLMVLFNKRIDGIKKSDKVIDHIQNWTLVLNEMKGLGIDYRSGSSELANGDLKATLAFQWALIRKSGSSLISGITGGASSKTSRFGSSASAATTTPSATPSSTTSSQAGGASSSSQSSSKQVTIKEQLMTYLNMNLPPNLQVTNFTNCFKDGLLLQSILRGFAHIDVEHSDNPEVLLDRCFAAVEQQLGVPRMFSASDLAHGLIKEEPVMTYLISILQAVKDRTEAATRAPPTPAEAQAVDQYLESPRKQNIVTAQVTPTPTSQTVEMSHYNMNNMNMMMNAANQNYLGSLVQGSVPMELPQIFSIVAFADFNNFARYTSEHPNELFTVAEPYHINILFTAARIMPHKTAIKFMDHILQQFPNAHQMQDRKGNFPMHEALEYGCIENFEYLQRLPGAPCPPTVSLLHASVWPDTLQCAEYMLTRINYETGAMPIDNYVWEGRTPLMTALSVPRSSLNMLRFLLQRGSNPAFSPTPGSPPAIIAAAACDRFDAVECMLREGLYQPLPLVRLLCALLCIGSVTPASAVNFIRITGVTLNVDDKETGRSPLELAISIARADLVEVLLQHGADINRVTMQSWRSPIHYALRYYETDPHKYGPVLGVMQKWGANFGASDCNNYPAYDYARKLGLNVPPPQPVMMGVPMMMAGHFVGGVPMV